MQIETLNGLWEMRQVGKIQWIKAQVPGSMYNDLLTNGRLEDPFYRDNEYKALELSSYDYEYKRTFYLEKKMIGFENLLLCCDGLDTLAEIFVNDKLVSITNNMHRKYEFDIKQLVNEGENTIHIIFRSPVKFISEKFEQQPIWGMKEAIKGISYIRKAHSMFGWDWGPKLPDMGVWRDIYIAGYSSLRLGDVYIRQQHEDSRVNLNININLEGKKDTGAKVRAIVTSPDGSMLEKEALFAEKEGCMSVVIDKPQLWWPNGYGKQPLYKVSIELIEDNDVYDAREYKIGLRTMTVTQKQDQWPGRTFAITVNGVEIFSMGADYIPEDNILPRYSRDRAKKLIESCVQANFNTIRIWGGGIYPDDYFYDLCDKYGLVVWQDMMFACAVYDLTDEFKENIIEEVKYNIKRVRNHASLGLICGNNEIEWKVSENGVPYMTPKLKTDYLRQFEIIIADEAANTAPDTFYWVSSPSSNGGYDNPNDENYGDVHNWDVWHCREPFTHFRNTFPRFISEYGLQSFPCMKTVESYTLPEDRNIFSYIMESHQKNRSGNELIMYYMSQYYKFPKDFESVLYLSQLIQAEGVRCGVEHWRRNRGRCMGSVYWQLNDCWPVASWSSIDYFGRWKVLHYAAKRFYAPIMASACEDGVKVSLHVANETLGKVNAKLEWRLCDACSNIVLQSEKQIEADALTSIECEQLDFSDVLDTYKKSRNYYLEFKLFIDDSIVSSGTTLFVPAKHFEFINPKLKASVEEEADKFIIKVTSEAYAKFVELGTKTFDAIFSDNYFDLSKGDIKTVVIDKAVLSRHVSLEELNEQLTVKSLYDSYI